MKYFVVVYNQASGDVSVEEFPEASGRAALDRRFELEAANRERVEVEVVLLGAESRQDLSRTHARYFKSIEQLAAAS
jgi:tRNA pseudouridine-54 N-methylase